jgi:quercetin 2,3-dioxygenase
MSRPACVINIRDMPGERRPRYTSTPGVGAIVRSPGHLTGLTQMGVNVRTVEAGFAGTNRHFHTLEEEWTYVLSGDGRLRIGPLELSVGPGHFAGYPTGPRPHHLVNDGADDLVFLEGGESRPLDDAFWYPDVRKMGKARAFVEPYVEPPPEQGDETQVVHVDDVPVEDFQHDVEPKARRRMRALHRGTGLKRQAVYLAEVRAGDWSTAFHRHERTDEWVFILSGNGIARVGDDRFAVGPDDFIGYPARGQPHVIEATTDLTYLMGGQVDSTDVIEYPEHRMRRAGSRLEPLAE